MAGEGAGGFVGRDKGTIQGTSRKVVLSGQNVGGYCGRVSCNNYNLL